MSLCRLPGPALTTQQTTSRKYRANGVEVEAGYRFSDFRITAGLTYTDAKIRAADDPTVVGHVPRRQADLIYQIAPSYVYKDFTLGATIIGTTKSFADDGSTITLPAFTVVNAFAKYQFTRPVSLSIGVNNLFDQIGYTEAEGDGHAARSVDGRSVRGILTYSF